MEEGYTWTDVEAWRGWMAREWRRLVKRVRKGEGRTYVLSALMAALVVAGWWVVKLDALPWARRRLKGWLRSRPSPERMRQQRLAKLSSKS